MTAIQIIGIGLVALQVALSVLAIGLAVLAFYGYATIKQEAQKIAREAAKTATDRFLDESNVREMLQQYVAREAERLYRDMEQSPTHELSTKEKEDV